MYNALTSAERGKTHTVLVCFSFWIRHTPYNGVSTKESGTRDGALPNTLFANSDSGLMNSELFRQWFNQKIPRCQYRLSLLN